MGDDITGGGVTGGGVTGGGVTAGGVTGGGLNRTSSSRQRFIVVGGGLAGISAALACADAGADVTLFEKRSRLGGLTWSFSHDGLVMDNGQHVFLRCCTAYLDFLHRIGSDRDVELQRRLDVTIFRPAQKTSGPAGDPGRAVLRRDPLPAPLHLGRSLLRYGLLPVSARLGIGRAAIPLSRLDLNDPALDQQTFASWLARHGQSEAAVSALWDLICLPTVNLPATEASLSMAAKVFQTGLLTDAGAGDIGWSRVPLGVLHGERAAAALRQSGVQVRLGEPVLSIRAIDAAGTNVPRDVMAATGDLASPPSVGRTAQRFEVRSAGGSAIADGVVVALPHYCTEDVLPDGALADNVRPSKLTSSPIVNVHVHFDRRVTDLAFLAGLGTEAQWVFDRTASSGAKDGQYLAVSISAADSYIGTRPEDLGPRVVASLRAILPAARPANVLSTFVTKEHQATFRASPGAAVHRAATRTRVPGLVLAGAWTATGWPPTMESAVRSGLSAARAVLVASGQREGLPPLPREASAVPRAGLGRVAPSAGLQTAPDGTGQQIQPAIGTERASGPLLEPIELEEVV
jgi:squalene-associated FAD-dependent desaturase